MVCCEQAAQGAMSIALLQEGLAGTSCSGSLLGLVATTTTGLIQNYTQHSTNRATLYLQHEHRYHAYKGVMKVNKWLNNCMQVIQG